MQEQEMEEKQNYLRENILNKGYDANEFVQFLQSKKGEAASDISNWSMRDLHLVVQEFIAIHTKENNTNTQSQPLNTQNDSNNNNINNSNNQGSNVQSDFQIIENNSVTSNENNNNNKKDKSNSSNIEHTDENFGIIIPQFIDCKKAEINKFNNQDNLQITVTDPQKINNGFFSKTYVNFLISTNPLNIKVRRKHYDFVWLRERLSIIYNLNVLPRLPKKGKVNGDTHIKKRMKNLERFLNYLLKDNLIKNSEIFYDFLTIEKDEELEKKKKIYNKLKTPTEFKDIQSMKQY